MGGEQQQQTTTTSQIEDLATAIGRNTATVSNYLRSQNQAFPSFESNGPVDPVLHDDAAAEWARQQAIMSARTLIDLLQGPQTCLRPCYNEFPIQAISKFRIAQHVPKTGTISFAELANLTKIYEPHLRRIIRHVIMYHRCFLEPVKGEVAHSAGSLLLATNSDVQDGVRFIYDDFSQAYAHTVEALQLSRTLVEMGQRPDKSGWALAHNGLSFYDTLKRDAAHAARFSGAMKFFSASIPGNNSNLLLEMYPWAQLSAGAKVVDVGGANGYISAMIARDNPKLELVCEDLPHVANIGLVPDDLKGRMSFLSQDIFEEQMVKGADVYLLRWILHNWADTYVVQILRNLIPALKKGAKIVINDYIGPGQCGSMPELNERFVRELDSMMLALFNSYEREIEDWERVVREASPKFGKIKTTQVEGTLLAVLEVEWLG